LPSGSTGWRIQINQPMGGTGAYHGEWGLNTLSKLKPAFYRSPFNRSPISIRPLAPRSRGWKRCCDSIS
jgi:hypothetical protein